MANDDPKSNGCPLLLIATGIFCAAGGFLTAVLGSGGPTVVNFSALAMSVGFAIVLGAFGTKAAARFGNHGFAWTIGGPGATAVILLFVFHWYLNPALTKLGSIEIVPPYFEKVADLRIVDEFPLYEYRDSANKSIHFIMLREKFNHSRVTVQVDTTEKDDGKAWFEMVGDGDEIIRKHLGRSWEESARWTFDYPNHIIKDGNSLLSGN